MQTKQYFKQARGFTLLEIIIVVGLIAALAGALIKGLSGVAAGGQVEIERQFVTAGLKPQLLTYKLNMGSYPTNDQGLQALYTKPAGVGGNWRGPYMENPPIDSWGSAYNYRNPGENNPHGPDIWSSGPNGRNENGGGDDIANWVD